MGAVNSLLARTIRTVSGKRKATWATRCSGSSLCLQEMILIPGAGQTIAGNPTVGENYEKFCGINLNSLGFPAVNSPIISCDCPFELSHITGITALVGTATGGTAATLTGFQLSYSQIAGNC